MNLVRRFASEVGRSARHLLRNPSFAAAAILLLALGVGLAVTVLSFTEAVLLRRLPVPHSEELIRIVQQVPRIGVTSSFPEAYYESLRGRATALAFVIGESGEFDHFAITSPLPSDEVSIRGVTPGFFQALGVQPLYGRVFVDEDANRLSESPPIVVSHRLWQRRFSTSPNARGVTVALNGQHFAVVGVMPQTFSGLTADTSPDLWMPLEAFKQLVKSGDKGVLLQIAARLKSGSSREQAEVESLAIWQATMKDYYRNVERQSEEDASQLVARGVAVESLERGVSILRASFDNVLKVVFAASVLLLLAVCLTVGGLLAVQALSRQAEFAVRSALGASWLMLLRQLWLEAFVLVAAGGVGGIVLAVIVLPLAEPLLPALRDRSGALLPLTLTVAVDSSAVLFTAGTMLAVTLLFVAFAAVGLSRTGLHAGLHSSRATIGIRVRYLIVASQIAVCTLLVFVASLAVRTFHELRSIDTGFDKEHVATFTGDLSLHSGTDAASLLPMLLERVRTIPGVASASVSTVAVMRGRGVSWTIAPAGEQITAAHFLDAAGNTVSPDYFETMGIRLVRGRTFTLADRDQPREDKAIPAVVNETFVSRFFSSTAPVGKYFGPPVNGVASQRYVIVGVVTDAKYRSLREPVPPTFFALGMPTGTFVLNVKTSSPPGTILEPVRSTLAAIDPSLPFREVHTLDAEVESSMTNERLTALVVSAFGVCAAIVATTGIYGLVAYLAVQRRREIGIRMALGATAVAIGTRIAKETVVLVIVGVLIGLVAGAVVASAGRSMLFNVSPKDPGAIAATIAFVAVVTSVATAGPILRATRMSAAQALRQ